MNAIINTDFGSKCVIDACNRHLSLLKCSGDAAAATASTSAAATEGALRADDSFCQLIGGNLTKETQCLDDWRLQLLELLPAAGIQLTEAQVWAPSLLRI